MKSQPFGPYIINPYLPSGLFHPYQMGEFISSFRRDWYHFYLILIEIPVNQTPRSASAKVAEKGRQANMG